MPQPLQDRNARPAGRHPLSPHQGDVVDDDVVQFPGDPYALDRHRSFRVDLPFRGELGRRTRAECSRVAAQARSPK